MLVPPEMPELPTPQPPQYTVEEPIILDARAPKHTKAPPKGASSLRAMPGARLSERDFFESDPKPAHSGPSLANERDFFDVDLKTVRQAPRRVMDREDPYKP
jgi:hypothetical protein